MDEEKIIIGGWLLGRHLEDMDILEPSDFPYFGKVVKAIGEVGTDLFTLSRKLNMQITDFTEMTGMYQEFLYGQAVRQLADNKARVYLSQVTKDTPISEIAETVARYAETNLSDVPEPEKGIAMRYMNELDRRYKTEKVSWSVGIDSIMHTVRTKELTSIAARPSVGKSAFCLQIALGLARQRKKVLYFPLEMSTEQTVERIVLRTADIRPKNLMDGALDLNEWDELSKVVDKVEKMENGGNFMIFEGCNDLDKIKRLVRIHKPYAVIIDQLTQLTAKRSFTSRREQFSYMTNELKRMSMSEDTAVILACQINRAAQDTEPNMANLKESGSIEEDSDNVIILHRVPLSQLDDTTGFNEVRRPMLVKVEKQRSGGTGIVQERFLSDRYTFEVV